MPSRGARSWIVPALVAGAVGAPSGWWITDRLEQANDFCNACHLEAGVRLHAGQRRDFDARPPLSLAGAHGAARVAGREDPAFRCIDCHGGTEALGRSRVKLLSAKDAFWYALGRFDEPEGMRWPLWDADCAKCHASFEEREGAPNPRFHELAVHNHELGMECVACHLVHEGGGLAEADFLHPKHVRSRCAECHREFEEEGEG